MRLDEAKPGSVVRVKSSGERVRVVRVVPGCSVLVERAPRRVAFETLEGERVTFQRPRRVRWTCALEVLP